MSIITPSSTWRGEQAVRGAKAPRVRPFLRKWQLPVSNDRTVHSLLLAEIKRIDPKLALFWNNECHRWCLYRNARKDEYVHVLTLGEKETPREPGVWLIDWLQKHDITRNGMYSLDEGTRKRLEFFEAESQRQQDDEAARLNDMAINFALDVLFCARGRASIIPKPGRPMTQHRHYKMKREPVVIGLHTGRRFKCPLR